MSFGDELMAYAKISFNFSEVCKPNLNKQLVRAVAEAESIERILEDQAFSPSSDLVPPPPPPPLYRQPGGRGLGEEPNHTMARKPGPV